MAPQRECVTYILYGTTLIDETQILVSTYRLVSLVWKKSDVFVSVNTRSEDVVVGHTCSCPTIYMLYWGGETSYTLKNPVVPGVGVSAYVVETITKSRELN